VRALRPGAGGLVETPTAGTLRLVTDLDPETLSAELVARVYRRRWQIECFFRGVRCVLGGRKQGTHVRQYRVHFDL